MPLYGHHYTANFRDPRPHLDNLIADTHHCSMNSLEFIVTEFESSELLLMRGERCRLLFR